MWTLLRPRGHLVNQVDECASPLLGVARRVLELAQSHHLGGLG